ncbi:ABC transporter ATP-binding protein [Jonquetella anthropi]|nr:ABC transporter ATP-binding protein [Jonquetella anthropi]EEX47870.1 ABC transporter, ATP-binding protein [Jonquetella anthropi E3_33 E1]
MLLQCSDMYIDYDCVKAVHGISMNVDGGEIVTLIGANGAGKSSVLRAITGLIKLNGGEIRFEGERIDGLSAEEIVKRGITMVPEGRHVFPLMTVKENLMMGAFLRRDKAKIDESIEQVFHHFPRLKERINQAAGTMSGGEQQMLVIGRGLMADPKLLLLDEPSLGVAPLFVQEIARAITAINETKGVSIILVEQNSRMALRVSHRAYVLVTGKLALEGVSAALRNDERVQKAYLGGQVE